ncbi:QcrA and Rieske domain-containing protein [Daejeonella lutea]|uniref:Cytochrome b6-f complex iron-sulfur subunit n=1 Tax=Daejeonella lutea TaxID=572036 RepID=A0A1T5ARF7_9SPHI|nr:Rieske 2Fe-2S domain-containing protein [Daejeonella lutea]SKB37614.1 cytochrome b6-f complex iron-sulfur subunit [Daejeonella lutea]
MKRTEFLSTIGIGLAAACTGCLYACGKGGEAKPEIKPPVPPSGVSFTIDLNTEIKSVGEAKSNNGVIVARIGAGNVVSSFAAVQLACSHEGTSIGYSPTQGSFVCPNHGSIFNNSGVVTTGPATTNLKQYTMAISGSVLTVTG